MLTGHSTRIDPAGDLVQGVINYTVQINLDPTTAPLRLDVSTNACIIQMNFEKKKRLRCTV